MRAPSVTILSAYPLQIFCVGYICLQGLNIMEWVSQIGPSFSNGYFVISLIATVMKFDAAIAGILLGLGYQTRTAKDRDIPAFIKTTAEIFIFVAGAFSLTTLIVTFSEMHSNAFGVMWVILLVMIG